MTTTARASSDPTYVTTLHVANIHCPTCETYAKDVLQPVIGVHEVDVSIINHTIRVRHDHDSSRTVVDELVGAGFEVQHVNVSRHGRQVLEYDRSQSSSKSRLSGRGLMLSRVQRRHVRNCKACQQELSTAKRRLWRITTRSDEKNLMAIHHDRQSSRHPPQVSNSTSPVSDEVVDVADPKGRFEATIIIGGMTCASCANAITREVEALDFVDSISVNVIGGNAQVRYQGLREYIDKVVEAIEEIGYEASVDDLHQDARSNGEHQAQNDYNGHRKVSLSVDGMTCGVCVGTITRGLEEYPFISSINVDLVGNSATIEYDGPEKLSTILEKIDDLGYDATIIEDISLADASSSEPASTMRTVQLEVQGMFCDHCPGTIVSHLEETFGSSISISEYPSFKQPRITITYTPQLPSLTIRHLISAIESAQEAFTASVYRPPTIEERSRIMRRRELNMYARRLLFTFVVAIPTFIIGIVFMDLLSDSNSTKEWWQQRVIAGNVTRIDWALFFMATPVMFYGADVFHTRAAKEIYSLWRRRSKVPLLRRFYRFGSMNLLISAGTMIAYVSSVAALIMGAVSETSKGAMIRSPDTYFDSVVFLSFFILIGRMLEAFSKAKTGDAVGALVNLRPRVAVLRSDRAEDVAADSASSQLATEDGLPSHSSKRSPYKPGLNDLSVRSEKEEPHSEARATSQEVSVDLLEVGDTVLVHHGTSPPTDGIIKHGETVVFDESSLTGESKPVKKSRGDKVYTGSVNVSRTAIEVIVTELGGTSMLDQIVEVVREGQGKRAPVERIADIVTGYFVPVITLVAILTWLIWLGLGQSGRLPRAYLNSEEGGWPFWSLEFAIAVFVVACPCGIGLAAPTALFVGGGLAAKLGILVQGGGEAFQEASRLDTIVFDKTGTLTEGHMNVVECELLEDEELDKERPKFIFAMSHAMEKTSSHPIAKAVVEHCEPQLQERDPLVMVEAEIKEVPGQGLCGKFKIGDSWYEAIIGNERMLATHSRQGHRLDQYLSSALHKFQSRGCSTAIFAYRSLSQTTTEDSLEPFFPAAVFAITDPIRAETNTVLEALRGRGLSIHMCTGDNAVTAHAIASQLNIPVSNVRAGVLPQDKAEYIKELQHPSTTSTRPQRRIVAFVGDGTNDTPALAAADVSIALASGSDVAVTTASFILLNSDLDTILSLVKVAKRVFNRVKMNFAWALVYNMFLLPIAAGVLYPISTGNGGHFRLSPVWASAAMAASSVSVVCSSLALRLPEVNFGMVKRVLRLRR